MPQDLRLEYAALRVASELFSAGVRYDAALSALINDHGLERDFAEWCLVEVGFEKDEGE